jgi:two-component system phosphate regulon response regulator PhoB
MTTKVLIVDDQGDLRKLVRMTLDIGDYELHEAENAARAIQMLETVHPEIMIVDVMMPGDMNGIGLCQLVKSNPKSAHIKVFMLTAKGQNSDIEEGMRAGADGYLTKPFSPLKLIETVQGAHSKIH